MNKSTGELAFVTYVMNFAGSSARIFTTLKELGPDVVLLLGYGSAALLNLIIVIQIMYYGSGKPTKKAPAAMKNEKKKKTN